MEVDVTGNGQAPRACGAPTILGGFENPCTLPEGHDGVHAVRDTRPTPSASSSDDVLEYGRYRVFEAPDGGWVVARAAGTCQRCQDCGCGEQQDPIQVPGFVIGMAKAQADGGGLLAKVKAAMGRGSG